MVRNTGAVSMFLCSHFSTNKVYTTLHGIGYALETCGVCNGLKIALIRNPFSSLNLYRSCFGSYRIAVMPLGTGTSCKPRSNEEGRFG